MNIECIQSSWNSVETCFFLQGKTYQFDHILKPNITQENVYNKAAKNIVKGGIDNKSV